MNRTYRLKWNEACRTWIPVGENARTRGSRAGARALRRLGAIGAALVVLPSAAQTVAPNTLPTGFNVIQGSGSDSTAGNVYTVTQQGKRGVFGFDTFSIGSAATVNVKQDAGAAAMFVVRNDPSYIYGKFNADSTVFLVNPNGMFFGQGASINVGGLLATTMSMDADEFMHGRYRLTNPGKGSISNESVDFTAAGSVVLVANTVENAGKIAATTVTLAAGNTVAIDLTGNGLIRARVEDAALKASIVNSGTINAVTAVALTAGQARDTLDRVVNNSGTIRATGLVERGGEIVLEGGLVKNGGTLDASSATGAGGRVDVLGRDVTLGADSVIDVSGATSGGTAYVLGDMKVGHAAVDGRIYARGGTGNGGFVETSAAYVKVAKGFRLSARSTLGRNGTWLIDPLDFYITAGDGAQTSSGIGADTLSTILGNDADVTIETAASGAGTGNLYVDGVVTWSKNTLTLYAHRNIYVRQNLVGSGTAKLAFKYGMDSNDGNGANYYLQNGAKIYLAAGNNFTTWLGTGQGAGTTYTVVNSIADLQDISASGNYVLGDEIDASDTWMWDGGFDPIMDFTGRFDGFGHVISNFRISRSSTDYVGLFGKNFGVIRNVGMQNADITGQNYVGALVGKNEGEVSDSYVYIGAGKDVVGGLSTGGLVGWNTGSIQRSSAYGTVTGGERVGGLVGHNDGGSVSEGSTSGSVSGNSYVGGLVGLNDATHATATISRSYSSASVSSPGNQVGGLVGSNTGTQAQIVDSYASGSVEGTDRVGGLAGENQGTIERSFANGNVSGDSLLGGLVGLNAGSGSDYGTISDSYATGDVEGTAESSQMVGGLVGRNNGRVTRSYATGETSGFYASKLGALIGQNISIEASPGEVQDSFWLVDVPCQGQTPCTKGIGNGPTTGATGVTTDEMKKLSTFVAAGWDIDDAGGTGKTWRTYDGYTMPLLRSMLRPVTVTADDISKRYDGTPYTGSMVNDVYDPANAPGTERIWNFSDPYDSPTEVGEHLPKLYSRQDGYDISYVNAKLTIADTTTRGADSGTTTAERQNTVTETTRVVVVSDVRTYEFGRDGKSAEGDVRKDESREDRRSADVALARVNRAADPVAARSGDDTVAPPPKAKGRMLVCRKG